MRSTALLIAMPVAAQPSARGPKVLRAALLAVNEFAVVEAVRAGLLSVTE